MSNERHGPTILIKSHVIISFFSNLHSRNNSCTCAEAWGSDWGFYTCRVIWSHFQSKNESYFYSVLPIGPLLQTARGWWRPILPWVSKVYTEENLPLGQARHYALLFHITQLARDMPCRKALGKGYAHIRLDRGRLWLPSHGPLEEILSLDMKP